MCLVAFALGVSQDYPLILAANRDEMHERPSAPAEWWKDCPNILGGRDLLAGGTWLGVNRKGRLATVTNLRHEADNQSTISRGHLVSDYLATEGDAENFREKIDKEKKVFGPFNLLIFDGAIFHYFSNRAETARLEPGVHAISNVKRGTTLPKILRAKQGLEKCLSANDLIKCLFKLLSDANTYDDLSIAEETERMPHDATLFVKGPYYGTRSSTVVLFSNRGKVRFLERSFTAKGELRGECSYSFTLPENSKSAP